MLAGGGGDGGRIFTGSHEKQKWDMSGVDNVIWGVRWGPPWSQMVAVSVLDTDGVG